ncbi:ferredoxin [Caballeronia fortuita]|uniref:Ferredoxin n=1 Tax=Caballeronia fortuita TaxID=1777138 RepID=A0A158ABB2_9BURK|nr:PDR/VanB family oxidoreductase [Caballeronia fortuita]SAK54387.1 ferredoxin [Caballeronia fortuita]
MSLPTSASNAPMNMRVTAIRYAADDINVYEIRRPDNAALPHAEPGAHIDVHMPSGLMRQYSLVTADGDERAYLIGIKRDRASRGGSRFMHEQLRVGQMLEIGGPRNNFPLCETASHTVLIAGGIGITPIWCMAQRLMRLNRSFELHYACRERREAAFLDTFSALPQAHLHFDCENDGRVLDISSVVGNAPDGSHFYCCGPQGMLAGYEAATASIDEERVHIEYFAPRAVAACDGGYVVQLHRTGQQFEVPPGKTILQVLREGGVAAPYSCEEGICGACQVDVIEGTPDHRDSVLTERERASGETMMICCSGVLGERVVIDF